MQDLANRIANLEKTAKDWAIMSGSTPYTIPEKYRDYNFIVLSGSQSNSGQGQYQRNYNNNRFFTRNSDWVEFNWSKSGNQIVGTSNGSITVLFYK